MRAADKYFIVRYISTRGALDPRMSVGDSSLVYIFFLQLCCFRNSLQEKYLVFDKRKHFLDFIYSRDLA